MHEVHFNREASSIEGVLRARVHVHLEKSEYSAVDAHRVWAQVVKNQRLAGVGNGESGGDSIVEQNRGLYSKNRSLGDDVNRRLFESRLADPPCRIQEVPYVWAFVLLVVVTRCSASCFDSDCSINRTYAVECGDGCKAAR